MEHILIGEAVRFVFGVLMTLVAAIIVQQVVRRLLKFRAPYWMTLKALLSVYVLNWILAGVVGLITMSSHPYGLPITGNIVLFVVGFLIYTYILSLMIKTPEGDSIGIGNALGVAIVMAIIAGIVGVIVFVLNKTFL
jgi:hypothetical protein